jgi:uncharacterized protein (TIGR02452 family)
VAEVLARIGRVRDLVVLQAATLHDTIEDTDTTEQELAERFGVEVARIVAAVTDDKSLEKEERKRLQVEHASSLPYEAKLVKLADKICNVRDVLHSPPRKWSRKRRNEYVEWAQKVVDGCRGTNAALERHFDELILEAGSAMGARAVRARHTAAEPTAWDSAGWAERFRGASKRGDRDELRSLRKAVFRSTLEVVRDRRYEAGGHTVALDLNGEYEKLARETVFYSSTDELVVPAERRNRFETSVTVENADCLRVAHRIGGEGSMPAVLNMANRHTPGGGVLDGAGAQEENLFRRTALLLSLYPFGEHHAEYELEPGPRGQRYPIPCESGGIYSPPTAVFRSSERTGYAFLSRPFFVAFLTVPAISDPELVEREGRLWLSEAMAEGTVRKIRAILRIAARHGHADLVLSAFGCGAFRNPPHHVARLFRETLAEGEFAGVFRRVVFAVIDDHNAGASHNPEGNYQPFAREFADPTPRAS